MHKLSWFTLFCLQKLSPLRGSGLRGNLIITSGESRADMSGIGNFMRTCITLTPGKCGKQISSSRKYSFYCTKCKFIGFFIYHLKENKKVIAWDYKVMAQRRKEHQEMEWKDPSVWLFLSHFSTFETLYWSSFFLISIAPRVLCLRPTRPIPSGGEYKERRLP